MVRTRQAWIGPEEVVEVWFDPQRISFAALLEHGRARDCARRVWWRHQAHAELAREVLGQRVEPAPVSLRLDREQKYALIQTPLRELPLSEAQACRVNASLADEGFFRWLSPRQAQAAATLFVLASKQRARDEAELTPAPPAADPPD